MISKNIEKLIKDIEADLEFKMCSILLNQEIKHDSNDVNYKIANDVRVFYSKYHRSIGMVGRNLYKKNF